MPLYQYENRTGEVLELQRPVADRDVCPPGFRRVTCPRSVTVFGTSSDRLDPRAAVATVPAAFKELSNNQVNGFVKESGFTVDKVKQVWGM